MAALVLPPDSPVLHWAKWVMVADSGCWLWTGGNNGHGYPRLARPRGAKPPCDYAHRYFYEVLVGPIPDGLELDHLCRNRPCVNPDHLEPVTPKENARRAADIRTTCPQGHPFDDRNTYWIAGTRKCRLCHAIAERQKRHLIALVRVSQRPNAGHHGTPAECRYCKAKAA